MSDKINVIVIADTEELAFFRHALGNGGQCKIVAATADHDEAFKAAKGVTHPVFVLRVKNPEAFNGTTERLNEKQIPYVCVCANAKDGFAMLQRGASEMIPRSEHEMMSGPHGIEGILNTKIKLAHNSYFTDNTRQVKQTYGVFDRIIAIGSSTGGTEPVLDILRAFPPDIPPVLIVQHMPPVFTKLYAERMNGACKLSVWEAQHGDVLKRGLALLAPGDAQMTLEKKNGVYSVNCASNAPVSGHCPSVDALFHSVAREAGKNAIGVILTGMGRDGAEGLLAMRNRGAMTLGQDEESSVVYGMPKAAYDNGAVVKQLPANEIAAAIMEWI